MADSLRNNSNSRAVARQSNTTVQQQQQSSVIQTQSKQSQSSAVTTMTTSSVQMEQKQKQVTRKEEMQAVQQQEQQMQQHQSGMTKKQITQQTMMTTTSQKKQVIQQSSIQMGETKEQRQIESKQSQQLEQRDVENDGDEQTGDGDLQVTGSLITLDGGRDGHGSDLYFTSLVEKEQNLLTTASSYCLRNESENNVTNMSRALTTVHPDLISDLTPSILPTPSNIVCHCTEEKNAVNETSPDDDTGKRTRTSLHQSGVNWENEFEPEGADSSHDVRKKKKKVKKTESFSVEADVCDTKLKDLAEKYDVHGKPPDVGGAPCELRACEKRVFKNVSVATLRRGFCDVTAENNRRNDEFTTHLADKMKSGFSKFENAQNTTDSAATNGQVENQGVKKDQNVKPGTHTCKGCGGDVFVMEMIKAEKASWHKNCFRCTECKKALSVDTYESNAGLLYCKPHFRDLFQPKAVLETPEEKLQKIKRRPEVIIRENQPVELPPDVVRASIQPSTAELEELSVDVRSKFELFEHFKEQEAAEKERREPVVVKKSNVVLAKMSRFQNSVDGQIGVPDSDINGKIPAEVSDDDDDMTVTKVPQQHLEEINFNLNDVKSKWESGTISKKEEVQRHRQEEQARFRTRLCLGKNSQLKEMYEKATDAEENQELIRRNLELEQLNLKEKRTIKEMFEKGIVSNRRDSEEDETGQEEPKSAIDLEVFENGVAKTSRNLFQSIDKQLVSGGVQPPLLKDPPKKMALKSPSGIIGVNDQRVQGDIVKSSDVVQDEVRPEDVGTKFRFFETYQEQQERLKQKKVFRITPPREDQVKMDSPEREIYRDPNVVRATDTEPVLIPATKTASKMLSLFKKLEEGAANNESDPPVPRPLKQFTPPRETRIEQRDSSEEEGEGSDYESDEENEPGYANGHNSQQDKFLQEVGSLARAKSLRAKFEKWETEENARNLEAARKLETETDGRQDETHSIESAKALRAIFEQPQLLEQKPQRRQVQVKRFVELQNNNSTMEECVMCNKRVYAMEKAEVSGKIYHKTCFRCSHCKCLLRLDTFTQNQGVLFCKPHYTQLFRIKGNYDEGFGRETGKQIWAKKQQQQAKQTDEAPEN